MSADATEQPSTSSRVSADGRRVLVAVHHAAMRRLTLELVRQEHPQWFVDALVDGEMVPDAIRRVRPDVLVVDDGDFPSCCRAAIDAFPPSRVVVVGIEPDRSYEAAAFRAGAGAWVARDRLAEDLGPTLCNVLGRDDASPNHDHDLLERRVVDPAQSR